MLKVNYLFKNPALLQQALRHRSISSNNNECMEFLGDALLGLIVAEWVYHQHTSYTEGQLTQERVRYVANKSLAIVAYSLGLDKELHFCSSITQVTESMLAGSLEALIAAIYIDSNSFTTTRSLVIPWLVQLQEAVDTGGHPKSSLQIYLQERHLPLPVYRTLSEFQMGTKSKKCNMFRVQLTLTHLPQSWTLAAASVKEAHKQLAEKALGFLLHEA